MMRLAIHGRLGRDAKLIDTQSGKPMAVASIAVDLPDKAGDYKTEWLELLAFGRMAEQLAGHKKGEAVSAYGRGQINEYQNNTREVSRQLQVVVDGIVSASAVQSSIEKKNTGRDDHGSEAEPLDDSIPF